MSDTWTREHVAARVTAFDARPAPAPANVRRAAVAVCVLSTGCEMPRVIITRRSPKLRARAGQWALLGGRLEDGESGPEAARRALAEEIGLSTAANTVLGVLDDYPSRFGYVITPVVLWLPDLPATTLYSDRGNQVHEVPFDELDVEPRFISIDESPRPTIQLPLLGRYIHAPTGAILHQFREVAMYGRPTRVAHFEQPVFAWK